MLGPMPARRTLSFTLRLLSWAPALVACCFGPPSTAPAVGSCGDDDDAAYVAQLVALGDVPAAPREIQHFVLFDSEGDARAFADRAQSAGYRTQSVESVAAGLQWAARVTRMAPATVESAQSSRRELCAMAVVAGGAYGTWDSVGCLPGEMEVVAQLSQQGDDLTRPRRVDHFADFADPERATRFVAAIAAQGCSVVHAGPSEPGEPGWTVAFECEQTVTLASVRERSCEIMQLAAAHGGVYDGWGSPIDRGVSSP